MSRLIFAVQTGTAISTKVNRNVRHTGLESIFQGQSVVTLPDHLDVHDMQRLAHTYGYSQVIHLPKSFLIWFQKDGELVKINYHVTTKQVSFPSPKPGTRKTSGTQRRVAMHITMDELAEIFANHGSSHHDHTLHDRLPIANVRLLASMFDWKPIQKYDPTLRNVGFMRGLDRIDLSCQDGTVVTTTTHPKRGRTELVRRKVGLGTLAAIFENIRVHTGKGYYRQRRANSHDNDTKSHRVDTEYPARRIDSRSAGGSAGLIHFSACFWIARASLMLFLLSVFASLALETLVQGTGNDNRGGR
jgi:hypothetical protein